jgi:hypothetical protein
VTIEEIEGIEEDSFAHSALDRSLVRYYNQHQDNLQSFECLDRMA